MKTTKIKLVIPTYRETIKIRDIDFEKGVVFKEYFNDFQNLLISEWQEYQRGKKQIGHSTSVAEFDEIINRKDLFKDLIGNTQLTTHMVIEKRFAKASKIKDISISRISVDVQIIIKTSFTSFHIHHDLLVTINAETVAYTVNRILTDDQNNKYFLCSQSSENANTQPHEVILIDEIPIPANQYTTVLLP
jgi:hypothetical protein